MKVFVAGATGAMGAQLIPLLVSAGHSVVGMSRDAQKFDALRALGVEPVVADALNRNDVMTAVGRAKPDAFIHQLTALKELDAASFELTNRLRTEGTNNLLAAAREAGTGKFIAQSYTGWPYARHANAMGTGSEPVPPPILATLDAIEHLESAVTKATDLRGTVLRYGAFYGPGTSFGASGTFLALVKEKKFHPGGPEDGVWSFVHIHDAARATLLALEHHATGIYNIVDDEPASVAEWLPVLAAAVHEQPPADLPAPQATATRGIRGASNANAKRDLGWELKYPTWRRGFVEGLG